MAEEFVKNLLLTPFSDPFFVGLWFGVCDRYLISFRFAADEMDDGVQAQPGEKPNEGKGPACEQGGDMAGTGLWALFDQCSGEDQQPAEPDDQSEGGPPRHA